MLCKVLVLLFAFIIIVISVIIYWHLENTSFSPHFLSSCVSMNKWHKFNCLAQQLKKKSNTDFEMSVDISCKILTMFIVGINSIK